MRAAEAEAAQYRSMARGTRMGMWLSSAGALAGAIDGGWMLITMPGNGMSARMSRAER